MSAQYSLVKQAPSILGNKIQAFSNRINSEKYIYLIAGVHGNEPEGVYVLDKLFAWCKESIISKPLLIIPVANPDGFNAKTRVNARGVDLNRNWPTSDWNSDFKEARYNPGKAPLSEPENVFLDNCFKEFQPACIISLHSWKPILNHNKFGKQLAQFFHTYNHYILDESIGYPTPGSLGTYATEVLKCPILTYELPEVANVAMEEIWLQNAQGLQNYLLSEFDY